MTEQTAMLEALDRLQAHFAQPMTQMQLIRHVLQKEAAAIGTPEMPMLLNEEQRRVFADHIDKVKAFLNSEDGRDAMELVVTAFTEFAACYDAEVTGEAAVA
jgi:hypothetical protein